MHLNQLIILVFIHSSYSIGVPFQYSIGAPSQFKFFDLTYDVDIRSVNYPGQKIEYDLFKDFEGYNVSAPPEQYRFWFAMYSFCIGEHSGTHLDAPYHFYEKGWKMDEIPVERLMDVPTTLIDVERQVHSLPDPSQFIFGVEHILEHERLHGEIPPGGVVMINYGWWRYWPDRNKYNGIHPDGTTTFPTLGSEAAKWLVEHRGIVGVGVDVSSVDLGNQREKHKSHLVLCSNQVYIIENVAYRDDFLLGMNAYDGHHGKCDLRLNVAPIKSKGTGGPTRVMAYCKN